MPLRRFGILLVAAACLAACAGSLPAAREPVGADQARGLVAAYEAAIAAGDDEAAWALLSAPAQAAAGGEDAFRRFADAERALAAGPVDLDVVDDPAVAEAWMADTPEGTPRGVLVQVNHRARDDNAAWAMLLVAMEDGGARLWVLR